MDDKAKNALIRKLMTPESSALISLLENAGYEACFVGGALRDVLMGNDPHDFDIATSAPPQMTKQLAKDAGYAVFETGIKHGTVTVHINHVPFEVTADTPPQSSLPNPSKRIWPAGISR